MSNVARVAGTAANTLTTPLNVEEVFSTYLYTGNNSTQTITNGIDLDGEGGLVWIKSRSATANHQLFDTERGATKELISNTTAAENTDADTLTTFNANGFSIGADATVNTNSATYASWTWRKAPKFFDVVTYTGTGSAGLTVSHNLGSAPGCIIAKRTDAAGDSWAVYHRNFGGTHYSALDSASSFFDNPNRWNDTTATATEFTVGNSSAVNASGGTHVAYLFAHNDGDGGFGPTGDQDIIKCGSYTGNGSSTGPTVDLGFEPQWILIANSTTSQYWSIYDNMRGLPVGGDDARLHPNRSDAESTTFGALIDLLPNGFRPAASSNQINQSGDVYVYVAIRRGPMAVPESATDVFAMDTGNNSTPSLDAGFTIDASLIGRLDSTDKFYLTSRLTGSKYLNTTTTAAEASAAAFGAWDYQTQYYSGNLPSTYQAWMWRRAPGFFDAVAYSGLTSNQNIKHSLGVVPELIIIKVRNSTNSWPIYNAYSGVSNVLYLNQTWGNGSTTRWNSTAPTETQFTLEGSNSASNTLGENYIAYLFASLPGVSKVGSYTGNGSSQTINCGFTSGARFILIKRTDSTGDWYVWDTERGIVAGNDPHLSLNTTAAEVTTDDSIDPDNSGFIVNQVSATNINVSSATYIFYAIA
jgi:hypothetical protein